VPRERDSSPYVELIDGDVALLDVEDTLERALELFASHKRTKIFSALPWSCEVAFLPIPCKNKCWFHLDHTENDMLNRRPKAVQVECIHAT
jgi:hypothetical protein